ncbi:DUF3772 domain-containing protein, partial [Burkholderia sp. WAC0059]|uniref:DUF3772 domain-containing protein n=1 Tax=Burkholderia sp. WAC0059 TaxID=2066022 RepID=UPI000CB67F7E
MRKVCRLVVLLFLLAPLALMPEIPWADTPPSVPTTATTDTATAANLQALQGELDQIRQQASTATSNGQLADLGAATQQLANSVDSLLTDALLPERARLQAQLDVLGPPPAPGASAEAPAVVRQRLALAARQAQLDDELKQAQGARESLVDLGKQLARLQHNQLKDQLALRSGSILGMTFWTPLLHPDPADHQHVMAFLAQIGRQLQSAWQPAWRTTTALLLLLALLVWTAGNRLLERILAWLSLRHLPEGRLRRSTVALSTTLSSLVSTACAVRLIDLALTRQQPVAASLQDFSDELVRLALTCALIAGLGRALLCTHRPSLRLPVMADPVALAIKPFPRILAGLLLLSGALEQLNRTVDTSLQVTLFGRGIVSMVVALTIGAALLRANRIRSALAAVGEAPEARSTLAGLIHAAISLTVVCSLLALLGGYITIARFLTYELVWF